jgi:hypothetical protein
MKVTFAQAQEIAEQEIRRIVAASPKLSRYEFGAMYLRRDEQPFWTFGAASEQLMDEGVAPGAIFVSIDKKNGRIWNEEEITNYYERIAITAQQRQAA